MAITNKSRDSGHIVLLLLTIQHSQRNNSYLLFYIKYCSLRDSAKKNKKIQALTQILDRIKGFLKICYIDYTWFPYILVVFNYF